MAFFSSQENRIRCGSCNTEFDLNKNKGCPLCGLGNNLMATTESSSKLKAQRHSIDYIVSSPAINVRTGAITTNSETRAIGSWGMFNSFFPGKFALRVLGNMLYESKKKFIPLKELINKCTEVLSRRGLSRYRGFPNDPFADSSIGRFVSHFIKTFANMGLFEVKSKEKTKGTIWDEPWKNIEITLTKQGYEFATLRNKILDEHEDAQVLTEEEKVWLLKHLKSIDNEYKEYSTLLAVFRFIKSGHNGKDDLWNWFKNNTNFVEYVKDWSRKANDPIAFTKQINNLAPMFASAKLALLREIGVIKNKRNDYTVIGEI